jgi:hypothetical protein
VDRALPLGKAAATLQIISVSDRFGGSNTRRPIPERPIPWASFFQRVLETAESILDLALNLVGLAVRL